MESFHLTELWAPEHDLSLYMWNVVYVGVSLKVCNLETSNCDFETDRCLWHIAEFRVGSNRTCLHPEEHLHWVSLQGCRSRRDPAPIWLTPWNDGVTFFFCHAAAVFVNGCHMSPIYTVYQEWSISSSLYLQRQVLGWFQMLIVH